ncbi:MAG: Spo0B domain-containing protein [Ruminococcus flavefaciens]|nr:Spo0B domain-containing protein [Ruminococcus flavefaciens]
MGQTDYNVVIITALATLINLIFCVGVLLFQTLRAQKKKNIYSLEWERSRISMEQFLDYQEQYKILQDKHHDMKHHIRYINNLIELEDYDKLQEYLDSLIKDLS